MAERTWTARVLLAGAVGLVLVAVLTAVRGPVVLASAGTAALLVAGALGVLPLLGRDDVDWDWQPERADQVPPEPGIATLRRTLDPHDRETAAPGRLHTLVTRIAADRGGPGAPDAQHPGVLAAYLAAPPRRLTLDEVEDLVTELETLTPTKESP